ncbi:MAG: MaoC family dehydratase N-terminal domain-containing protein [Candidatus Eremiobacteraeota bacterium]|nr:MaoC family dehydratase N-terminal domain-containing protein [Candidatus Eremiobacteraeota bacterium]
MEISASYVGRVVAETDVTATFRDSAAYAAAIGAECDAYLDDRTIGGAWAPPWFVATLEWPLVIAPSALRHLAVPPSEVFRSVLHAFQDTRFDRPIRVGDRLHAEATLASVRQTKSGVLVVVRIATTDAVSHDSFAQSWFGAVFRGATAIESHTAFEAPKPATLARGEGATLGHLTISRGQSHAYGECARLWNPIHTERLFALTAGLPDIAVHGTLVWAKVGQLYADRFLDGDPRRLTRLYLNFRKPVYPGRQLLVRSAACGESPTHDVLEIYDGDDIVVAGLVEAVR